MIENVMPGKDRLGHVMPG